jgi:crotonobetainyl-CoA:carnitine CoA-transferase CaiB-like acyl-CoA transferase
MLATTRPLKGLRVLDLSQGVAGPHCGGLFAEYGAEVTKIEPPSGDWMRVLGAGYDGRSGSFIYYNRGKKSLCLDLKSDGAINIVLNLAANSDVVIDNNRPGVSDRLGIGFEALKARNPKIILVAVSGFGQVGPDSHRPLSDTIAQAMSGFMSMNCGRAGVPAKVDMTLIDSLTGLYGFQAATMALWGDPAERRAQRLDISLVQSAAAIQAPKVLEYSVSGSIPEKINVPAGSYRAKDGWLALTLVRELDWTSICKTFDRPDLTSDPHFVDFNQRAANSESLTGIVDEIIATRSVSDWVAQFRENGVLAGPINDYGMWLDDPQTVAIEGAPDFTVADGIKAPIVRTPGHGHFTELSPHLGEHSREILTEAGLSTDQIDTMLSSGAVICRKAAA